MERYVCIHGHFYQPPRENPWLEAIELQDSAYPYHDWNERITAECYAPNGRSRILDREGWIARITNNYARISFNFGPTLLAWLEEKAPDVYQAILEADRVSRDRFSGHGSALAQAYHHMILPLANRRDKCTQILWGIKDFEHRFGRSPEGMWLPETAVDLESLDILAQHGIGFTILSPHQASQVRPPGSRAWRDVGGGRIDPSMPYRIRLRSGRSVSVFFYDAPISRAIAFEDLLTRGENLASRLLGVFSEARTWPQIVHIATDGETYGHHRAHGDMALAYALHRIEADGAVRLTNYGEYLTKHPPASEVRIIEKSSWSCAHGVERWRSNCGCNSGGHPGWNQEWRAPLRAALDWLRDSLAPPYERLGSERLGDPWAARDDYISVILDRSTENLDLFLKRHAKQDLTPAEKTTVLRLLELQRHAMLMYTSCGWFFDELSGIETVQVIQYAGRALQLAREVFGESLEDGFLERLERAGSNLPEHHNGRHIYEKFVKPAMVDLHKVGAHYAVSSLFDRDSEKWRVFCHAVDREDFRLLRQGRTSLALGRIKVTSNITLDSKRLTFGVLHLDGLNILGGVREFRGESAYKELQKEITEFFNRGDVPELVRSVDKNFGSGTYSIKLLFRDEQRRVVATILETVMSEAQALYRDFYTNHVALIRSVSDLGIPLPKRFQMAVDFTLNTELRTAFSSDEPDAQHIGELLEEIRRTGISLDVVTLEFALRRTIEQIARRFHRDPDDIALLESLARLVDLSSRLPFEVRLWLPQNIYYEAARSRYRDMCEQGGHSAQAWVGHFRALGEKLKVRWEQSA